MGALKLLYCCSSAGVAPHTLCCISTWGPVCREYHSPANKNEGFSHIRTAIFEIIAVVMMLGDQFDNQMHDNDTILTDIMWKVHFILVSNRPTKNTKGKIYRNTHPIFFPSLLYIHAFRTFSTSQKGKVVVLMHSRSIWLQLLFVLTDRGKKVIRFFSGQPLHKINII